MRLRKGGVEQPHLVDCLTTGGTLIVEGQLLESAIIKIQGVDCEFLQDCSFFKIWRFMFFFCCILFLTRFS